MTSDNSRRQDRLSDDCGDLTFLNDTSILVTGGTGSFGQHFIRRVLDQSSPRRVIVFSRDELKQYEMGLSLASHPKADRLRFFIGDVRDQDRLMMAFRDVDYVVHAAALKQVPTAEYNPFECIHTNVLGAENVVRAAISNAVRRLVALSTDKAANPVNLYGASKLASDKIFVAANAMSGSAKTRFSVVRYGNVVGSRGSVVPLFRNLVAKGVTRLPITDERMTRFWITLDQGVAFVLRCLREMSGGEIFVPKIPSMRVIDLVRAIAPAAEFDIIGIRPGEKLHEVMITQDDARKSLDMGDHYVIEPAFTFWSRESCVGQGAQPVPDDFVYSSDSNEDWLNTEDLGSILEGTH